MRYSLHNAEGHRIGEADTAQGIADIAKPGTWSFDTSKPQPHWPCTVYAQEGQALAGTQYRYRYEAMEACRNVIKALT